MQNPTLSNPEPKQKGYTIIELGIALAIIAVLIVAGLAGVTSVLNSSKANSQIEDSGKLLARLQTFVSTTASTPSLTTAVSVGLSMFPISRVAANKVTNVFGGGEFVSTNANSTTHNVPTNTGAIYTLASVPKAVCADVAVSLSNLADSSYISTATAPATDQDSILGATLTTIKSSGGTINLATLGTACNSANAVNMQFVLKP